MKFSKAELCIEVSSKLRKSSSTYYVYGTDKFAAGLFFQLCSLRVSIKGFVNEEEDKIDTFYHKPVYAIEEIQKNSVILLPPNKKVNWQNCITYENILELNHKINMQSIAIYGCGKVGRELKSYLEKVGANVSCYIETASNKVGTIVDEIPVYSKVELKTFSNDASIIIAGRYWKEIDDAIQDDNVKLNRYYIPNNSLIGLSEVDIEYRGGVIVDFEKNLELRCHEMFSLEEHFSDKELVLYGSDIDILKKYAEIYSLLDYLKITIALDCPMDIEKKSDIFSIVNIADVLYKENYIILLQDKCKVRKLEELGFKVSKDFVMMGTSAPDNPYRQSALDINLGYTYIVDDTCENYPGVQIYGENKEDDFRIVVLGDSVSESNRSYIKNWVEILFDKYLKQNVTIFNCAMTGYVSGQYLIKLIRDGVLFKPNLIIAYGHTNDCTCLNGFSYLRFLFEHLAKDFNKKIITGNYNENNVFQQWLINMRYINAIAELNNAVFYAFIQPTLLCKNNYTLHEKKMMKMISTMYADEVYKGMKLFKDKAKEVGKDYSYIYDLTSIFDEEDVYMDICHVYENGNRIVADAIWNVIKDDVQKYSKIGISDKSSVN